MKYIDFVNAILELKNEDRIKVLEGMTQSIIQKMRCDDETCRHCKSKNTVFVKSGDMGIDGLWSRWKCNDCGKTYDPINESLKN